MKVLCLKLFQETACYTKPLAFKVGETYPLPPYSTVKGMLHALVKATELIPMRLSIQGSYDTLIVDYQTHSFFKKINSQEIPLVLDGLPVKPEYKEITRMPLYNHLLYHVELIVHVEAENAVLFGIIEAIEQLTTMMSLGRWEDLVRIDGYELFQLRPLASEEKIVLQHSAYIPIESIPNWMQYIPYRLNWTYDIKQGIREWSKIDVGYVSAGQEVIGSPFWVDKKGYPVLFNQL